MKNFSFLSLKNFRYERKFCLEGISAKDIEPILKLHPAIFKEIYYERRVNNIYLDSVDLRSFFDNINGISKRLKVRIRWYKDIFGIIKEPVLELKLKHNLHVGKLNYPLVSFMMDKSCSINTIRRVFEQSSLPERLKFHLKELSFSLLNSYRRRYFLSADKKYRITLDYDLEAYKLLPRYNSFLYKLKKQNTTVMELKYNEPNNIFANEITNYFSFRLARSSKYVDGIVSLYK
ncbi:MAG: VTC domain-containing protein [Candidatus Omnitrophica bacterium]|jgi:hypothetical protein|nr:VTC domain-containing protein [Candidatus Omnitrophota bacterium]